MAPSRPQARHEKQIVAFVHKVGTISPDRTGESEIIKEAVTKFGRLVQYTRNPALEPAYPACLAAKALVLRKLGAGEDDFVAKSAQGANYSLDVDVLPVFRRDPVVVQNFHLINAGFMSRLPDMLSTYVRHLCSSEPGSCPGVSA